ncbi:MAG: leucine-rich repeat domain-containing protein [Bacteroidales bacterium]|nr:leucine-rich repeat domain-containing protein [Bacteroidales bacterium]
MKRIIVFISLFLFAFVLNAATYTVSVNVFDDLDYKYENELQQRVYAFSMRSLNLVKGDNLIIKFSGFWDEDVPYFDIRVSEYGNVYPISNDIRVDVTPNSKISKSVTVPITKTENDNYPALYCTIGYPYYKFDKDGFSYSVTSPINPATVEITRYNGTSSNVVIPSSVIYQGQKYVVEALKDCVFLNCSELKSVTIPKGVEIWSEDYSDELFGNCNNLETVIFEDYHYTRGGNWYIIENCHNIKEIISLSEAEFLGEAKLTPYGSLSFYNGGKTVVDNDFAFSNADKKLVKYTGSSQSINLPENFKGEGYTISAKCFSYNPDAVSLYIPQTVLSVDKEVFSDLTNLTSVLIEGKIDLSNSSLYLTHNNIKYRILNESQVSISRENDLSGNIVIPEKITAGNTFDVVGIDYCSGNLSSLLTEGKIDLSNAYLYVTYNNIKYRILNESQVSIYKANDLSGDIVIPERITVGNTFNVVGVGGGAFSGNTELTSVTIGNGIKTIESSAFSGCTNLKTLIVGKDVQSIGSRAFENCSKLINITCYPVNPPEAYSNSFSNYNGYISIPCDNKEDYEVDAVFGTFKHVDCLTAEEVMIEEIDVVVEPEISEAEFVLPAQSNADNYSLTITNEGDTFCVLNFNGNGQLTNIDFSGSSLKSESVGYQFTVTGLSSHTDYGYRFLARSKNTILKEYTGVFTTKNEDGTGGSFASNTDSNAGEQGGNEEGGNEQGGTTPTAVDSIDMEFACMVVDGQILVNGEAPEFVTTVLGQKIANKNLKSGIYFVLAGNKQIGVSVR